MLGRDTSSVNFHIEEFLVRMVSSSRKYSGPNSERGEWMSCVLRAPVGKDVYRKPKQMQL